MTRQTDQGFDLTGHYLWRPNGSTPLLINGRATPLRDGTGNALGAVWVFRDATADQQLAAQLQAVLGEQEVLFREVHHRIKNNFQTIASLLGMQANAVGDQRTTAVRRNGLQRHRSMALVHQSLCGCPRWAVHRPATRLSPSMGHRHGLGRRHGSSPQTAGPGTPRQVRHAHNL